MTKYTLSFIEKLKKKNVVLNDDIKDLIQNVLNSNITNVISYKKHIKKSDTDKKIDDLRKLLNKITASNYNTLEPNIYNILDTTNALDDKELNTKLAELVFNILSRNSFYTEIYSKLFINLINRYPYFNYQLSKSMNDFIKSIESIDSETLGTSDYDTFCDNNKKNDEILAISKFYIYLSKSNIISSDIIIDLILDLQYYFNELIQLENKSKIAELLANIIFELISSGINSNINNIFSELQLKDIKNTIQDIVVMKAKDYNSLTNRAIFKYMDINDIINKTK